jgi:hypothetical protein
MLVVVSGAMGLDEGILSMLGCFVVGRRDGILDRHQNIYALEFRHGEFSRGVVTKNREGEM